MSGHLGGHPGEKTRTEEPGKVKTPTEAPTKIEIGGTPGTSPAPLTNPLPERELVPARR